MKRSLLLKGDTDDQVIKKLEKKLKLKKNVSSKHKNRRLFKNDGLDYILDVTDMNSIENFSEDSTSSVESLNKWVRNKREGVSKGKCEVNLGTHDYKSQSSVGKGDIKDCYKTEEIAESVCDNTEESRECSEVLDDVKEQGCQFYDEQRKEYKAPYSKQLKVPDCVENKTQAVERLKRQLKGLINRLSESNMQSVSSEVESLYMRNSRNDMNELLFSIIYEFISMPSVAPQRLTMEQALLVAILQSNTDSELGTFILLKMICKFNQLLKSGASYGDGKLCDNLLSFIAELYSFKVCSSILIFDILKLLADSFQDKDVDLILLLMQSVGGTLRKDNPSKMKEIIKYVQCKASSVTHAKSSRVQFMLETLTAVHYNNLCKISSFSNSLREHLRKVLRNCLRPGCSVQEICISYEDIIKAENTNGSFQDCEFFKKIQFGKAECATVQNSSQSDIDFQVAKLACQQHMNTPLRKSIFCIIMSAEDYVDAFQKLLPLDSKNQSGSDMMNILVHCALHEKSFNPYYALLAGMFCKFSRKYHMSLQFSLWDRFKVLHTFKPYQRRNLSSFMVQLILKEDITLSVLKVIHFSEMNKHLVIFLKEILLALLLHDSDEDFTKVFKRITSVKKLDGFREEMYLFMVHFLLNEESKHNITVYEKLEERVKLVKKMFNIAKKQ